MRIFEAFLVAQGMPTTVGRITREHVETFIADQLRRWAPTTYRCLRQYFRWLVEDGEIASSPMANMRPPSVPEVPVPMVADDELRRLLDACEGKGFTELDRRVFPQAVRVADGPDDLARYFRDIHANALKSPIIRVLAQYRSPVWNEVRQRRRTARLDAIRRSVAQIGAPKRDTEDVTAMLLVLAGGDICWPMYEDYGLPIERIPDTIANTVQLVVDDLKAKTRKRR